MRFLAWVADTLTSQRKSRSTKTLNAWCWDSLVRVHTETHWLVFNYRDSDWSFIMLSPRPVSQSWIRYSSTSNLSDRCNSISPYTRRNPRMFLLWYGTLQLYSFRLEMYMRIGTFKSFLDTSTNMNTMKLRWELNETTNFRMWIKHTANLWFN